MQISVSSVFNLMILLIILMLTVFAFAAANPPSNPTNSPAANATQAQNQRAREGRKPGWVQTEVLRLLAMTRGHAGCRMVAALFNARFAFRGESVSKTYVAELRKRCHYEISQLRKVMRQAPRPGKPNQTWALDWTHVTIGVETHTLLGVIDHGSRRLLALCFADKSANTVLRILSRLIKTFGRPKSLRTDNEGALVSTSFALAMLHIGINTKEARHTRPG